MEEADITEEANFQEDLGADSLDLVEMIMELEDQFGIKIRTRTPRRSRRSVRLSNTRHVAPSSQAQHAEPGRLARLIDELPAKRAENLAFASFVGSRQGVLIRAAGVSGDSVWSSRSHASCTSVFLTFQEGRLAKIHSHVVSRASCAGRFPRAQSRCRSWRRARGSFHPRSSIGSRNRNVSQRCSRPRAALFLEHGFEPIEEAIVEAFGGRIEYAATTHVDYKTDCRNSWPRSAGRSASVLEVEGPPHDRKFTSAAVIDGDQAEVGVGSSKKAAEQEAAKQALEKSAPRRRYPLWRPSSVPAACIFAPSASAASSPSPNRSRSASSGRRRGRRAERLRQVQRRRRAALGVRQPEPERARAESPTTCCSQGRAVASRCPYCQVELVLDNEATRWPSSRRKSPSCAASTGAARGST